MKKFIFLILMTSSAISFGITKSLGESSEWQYADTIDEMTDGNTHIAMLWAKEKAIFNEDSLYARLGIGSENNGSDTIVCLMVKEGGVSLR